MEADSEYVGGLFGVVSVFFAMCHRQSSMSRKVVRVCTGSGFE